MPTIRINDDQQFQILHHVPGQGAFAGGVRTFRVGEQAQAQLAAEGYRDGHQLDYDVFFSWLEEGLIWAGAEPRFPPRQAQFQIELTTTTNQFFQRWEASEFANDEAVDLFRIDILAPSLRIQDQQLRRQFRLHLASRLERQDYPVELEQALREMRALFLNQVPEQESLEMQHRFAGNIP